MKLCGEALISGVLREVWGSLVTIACLQAGGLLVGTHDGRLELGENASHCERSGRDLKQGWFAGGVGLAVVGERRSAERWEMTANVSLYIARVATLDRGGEETKGWQRREGHAGRSKSQLVTLGKRCARGLQCILSGASWYGSGGY